jgi:O-antigen ligase
VVSPNVLGSLLVVFIMVTAGRLLTARGRWERWFYLSALAAMTACMVFTYSRGAWLALGLAATAFSLMYNPRLLIVMAAGSLAAVKFVPGIGARLSYMFSSAYVASSQRAGRLALWQSALDRFRQDPLFGTGFGSFGGAVAARRIPGSYYVDNFYLKTLVESGLIGLLALLWLLGSAFRCGYAVYKKINDADLKILAAAILAGLLGVAAHNAVENIFEVPMMATYFWLLAGMLTALPHIDDSEPESAEGDRRQENNT